MWFFDKYKGQHRQKIQEEFYGFLRRTKQHIQFFDWFEVYSQRKRIDYPFSQTTNVVTRWQTVEGEIQAQLPPSKSITFTYKSTEINVKPFKLKNTQDEGAINSKDIQGIYEQNNYTNKYLQTLGEYLLIRPIPKISSITTS